MYLTATATLVNINLHSTADLTAFLSPPSPPTASSRAQTTQQLNPRKQPISTFVNYTQKNRPVVSLCDNGASTTEGLPLDNAYAELSSVMKGHVVGNN